MKKSILTSLTALAISTAQAGFIIKIPLEQAQGGHLPNGSIKLSKPSTTPPQEPSNGKECHLNQEQGFVVYRVEANINEVWTPVNIFIWDSERINAEFTEERTYQMNGYLYSSESLPYGREFGAYEICREPM